MERLVPEPAETCLFGLAPDELTRGPQRWGKRDEGSFDGGNTSVGVHPDHRHDNDDGSDSDGDGGGGDGGGGGD